jgi:hypothetical protein
MPFLRFAGVIVKCCIRPFVKVLRASEIIFIAEHPVEMPFNHASISDFGASDFDAGQRESSLRVSQSRWKRFACTVVSAALVYLKRTFPVRQLSSKSDVSTGIPYIHGLISSPQELVRYQDPKRNCSSRSDAKSLGIPPSGRIASNSCIWLPSKKFPITGSPRTSISM